MSASMLLMAVRDGTRRYLVPNAHVDQIRLLDRAALPSHDDRGRPLVVCALGDLLDPGRPHDVRRHALIVSLRRRSVVLLVERVEMLADAATVSPQPLPALIERSLAHAWYLGAAIDDGQPVLVLDLRRIALDMASSEKDLRG